MLWNTDGCRNANVRAIVVGSDYLHGALTVWLALSEATSERNISGRLMSVSVTDHLQVVT